MMKLPSVASMVRAEKRSMKAAGWKYVSTHRSVSGANRRARRELYQMFKKDRILPEVKIVPLSKKHKTRLLFRRWRG